MTQSLLPHDINRQTTVAEILALFENSKSDLLLIDENLKISKPHLDLLADFPHQRSVTLVAPVPVGTRETILKNIYVSSGTVLSIGTNTHQCPAANMVFVGALRLSQNQRPAIVDALQELAQANFKGDHILKFLTLALVRNAIAVSSRSVSTPYWKNTSFFNNEQYRELSQKEEKKLQLNLANRSNDGFYSVFFLRKLSKPLTAISVRLGLSPNIITFISFLIGFYSAYLFTLGSKSGLILGALFFQLSLIVDCVDGEVARYTRKFSAFGKWLDASTDRVKEYLVLGALAYGAAKNGGEYWIWTIALMTLQTFRHLSDYTFSEIARVRESNIHIVALKKVEDGYLAPEWQGQSRLKYWVKKIINFPIGERWLTISATAAIGGAKLVFPSMVFFALVSLVYAWLTRIRRTIRWPKNYVESNIVGYQYDRLSVRFRMARRFEWVVPSILRLEEVVASLLIFYFVDVNRDQLPAFFFFLFAVIYHHYDSLYRALQGKNSPRWLSLLGLYVEGRIILVAVFALLNLPFIWLALWFSIVFIGIATWQWFIQLRRSVD